jgi:hypothetical protein
MQFIPELKQLKADIHNSLKILLKLSSLLKRMIKIIIVAPSLSFCSVFFMMLL